MVAQWANQLSLAGTFSWGLHRKPPAGFEEKMQNRHKTAGYLYFLVDLFTLLLEAGIYFASLSGPLYLLWRLKPAHPLTVLPLVIVGWLASGSRFILILVLLKRLVDGDVSPGRFFLTSRKAYAWMAGTRLVQILIRSPFHALVNENAFFRHLFYRGMGADVHSTLLLGNRVKIPDPWFIKAGRHVHIGDEAVISGHKVEHNTVTLDWVEIGDNVLIGARAIVFPGVKVGNGAIVGAASVVARGTLIPAGETWSGNPARKVDPFELPNTFSPAKQIATKEGSRVS